MLNFKLITFSSLKTEAILEFLMFLSKVLIDRYCLCIDGVSNSNSFRQNWFSFLLLCFFFNEISSARAEKSETKVKFCREFLNID